MSYQIFARKYRPQTFEEMVDQKAVVQTLQNAIKNDRVAQAYIFSGMRGVGKTTAARILAKALNCKEGPTPKPCNSCEFCKEINEDRSIDVLEIDGASNRGIDDIRALREAVKYKALHSRHKIIIIDEVHQVTGPAFNALLKTLEEPPPNTIFIFATTEFFKVPATITSRCQHFEFKKVPRRDIVNHLNFIAGKEGLTISAYGLSLIAEASEGSIRDAQSLLDQAVAFSGETIGDQELKEILGAVSRELLFEFSSAVIEEKSDRVFSLVEKVIEAGYDLRFFYKELVQHFRNLLVARSVGKPEDFLQFGPEDLSRLKQEAEKASIEDLLRYLQALQNAEQGLRFSSHPQIYFETLMVKLCHFGRIIPLKDLLRELGETGKGGSVLSGGRANPAAGPGPPKKIEPAASTRSENLSESGAEEAVPPEPAPFSANPPEEEISGRKGRDMEAAMKDPTVRYFVDKFKARVLSVDSLKGRPEDEEE